MRHNIFFNFTPIPIIIIKVLLLILLTGAIAQAQEIRTSTPPPVFQGIRVEQKEAESILAKAFSASAVYQFDVDAVVQYVHTPTEEARPMVLRFGEDKEWNLLLEPVQMVLPGATITIASETGVETRPLPLIRAFKGVVIDRPDDSEVRLTVNDDFLYGFVRVGNTSHFIQPLRPHLPNAAPDLFVLYNADGAIRVAGAQCGNTEVAEKTEVSAPEQAPCTGCKVAGIGMAADFSMFAKYGSVSAVLNHQIGVLNNVNAVYDNEFSCEIRFLIAKLFFSTCGGCDPWPTTTDSEDLLDDFKDWSNDGDFCNTATDVSELWTDRDLDGSTVGLAFRPGFCNDNAYHLLQDFTWDVAELRGMTAHEIGHNLNCKHDYEINDGCNLQGRGPLMMDPYVTSTTTWSNGNQVCALNSFSTISNYVNGLSCVGDCNAVSLSEAWVDFNSTNCLQLGSFALPFNLLQFAVHRVNTSGTINIKPSTSNETLTITKPCTLKAYNGTVVIGQQ